MSARGAPLSPNGRTPLRGQRRGTSSAQQSTTASASGGGAAAIDEDIVAQEAAARVIQQRFRLRHSSGNRPEARLFDLLKQTIEAVPDHLER